MKQGLFPLIFLLFSLLGPPSLFADDLDDFLEDAGPSQEVILIDIEEDVGADFKIVDDIQEREEKLEESLIIPPKYKKPRTIQTPEPYTAQLKADSVLIDLETGKQFRVEKPIIVKAQEVLLGAPKVFILDKEGKRRYETYTKNAINVQLATRIEPDINPLIVYTDKIKYGTEDGRPLFSHFFSYGFEAIRTNYYATIFRGETQTANSNNLLSKNYFLIKNFPVQFGFHLNYNFGFWEDGTLGTVTWQGLFFGPSVMRTFWRKKDSRWNMHLSVFKSLLHESQKDPDTHRYSTTGLMYEIEKEFDSDYGPLALGLSYKLSRSSIKETSEYLENEAQKGQIAAIGFTLTYRFDWKL